MTEKKIAEYSLQIFFTQLSKNLSVQRSRPSQKQQWQQFPAAYGEFAEKAFYH